MPTTKSSLTQKSRPSLVVKVTGMSQELLALLDARVRQQHAAGRAAYLRELIRKDALTPQDIPPLDARLTEYHALADRELRGEATPAQRERLDRIGQELDAEDASSAEAQETTRRQEEVSAKLDQLLALVQGLPKASG